MDYKRGLSTFNYCLNVTTVLAVIVTIPYRHLDETLFSFNFASEAVVNLAVLTTGASLSWSSPALVKLRNETETPLPRPITEEEGSWIVSGGYLIATFSNIIGGMLVDTIGRKNCVLMTAVPKLVVAILLIFANEVWIFILCRTISIVADSFVLAVVPIYASEIASKEHRGSLGTFLQLFSSLGILFTLSVGPFLSYKNFSIVFAGFIALLTLPLLALPDTPFHLFSKGRVDEAMRVLTMIRGSEIIAKQELEEYKAATSKTEERVDKIDLLKNKQFLKGLFLGIVICAGSQLIGSNAVNFYLQTILESTKTSVPSEIASVIMGAIQLLASFCTTLMMNMSGRRPILLTSLSGYCLGMLGLGTFFTISGAEGYVIAGFMNYLPIISLILVTFCFSAGIGSLLWVVTSELFEGPPRAIGITTSITSATILIFFTTKYFAAMTTALGPAPTYWFFSAMCALVIVIIAIFLPETKGKTFSEIQKALGDNIEIQERNSEQKNNV